MGRRAKTPYIQINLGDRFLRLTDRGKKEILGSPPGYFGDNVFGRIPYQDFAVIYSENGRGPSNLIYLVAAYMIMIQESITVDTLIKTISKRKARHQELCRINAINRRLAIREDVNHLRSLGDIFVTEPKNAKKLQKCAKNTTVDKNGKMNRKKRFGKSIQNRCPGYSQAQIEQKFTQTGGQYIEVPKQYRASQYDHPSGTFIMKKLSDRMYRLSDGTLVQRDWYSSFLPYCIDFERSAIDRSKCIKSFQQQYTKEKALIERIRTNQIRVCNSGIRIATA